MPTYKGQEQRTTTDGNAHGFASGRAWEVDSSRGSWRRGLAQMEKPLDLNIEAEKSPNICPGAGRRDRIRCVFTRVPGASGSGRGQARKKEKWPEWPSLPGRGTHTTDTATGRLVDQDCRPELEAALSLGQGLLSLAAIPKCFTTPTGSL